MIFKTINFYFKKTREVLPKKLRISLVFWYFGLLLSSLLEMLGLSTIPIFVAILIEPSKDINFFGIDIFNNYFTGFNNIFILSLLIISIYLLKNIFLLVIIYFETKITKKIKLFFSNSIFRIYLKKPYNFFLKKNSAELTRNIVNESQTATAVLSNVLVFSRELSILIIVSLLLTFYAPLITITSLMIMVSFGYLFYLTINKISAKIGRERLFFLKKIYNEINIVFGAIKDIKIYNKQKFFYNNFITNTDSYESKIFKQTFIRKTPKLIFEFLAILIIFFSVFIFLKFDSNLSNFLPILTLMGVSFVRLMPAFSTMSSCISDIRYCKDSFDIVTNEILNSKDQTSNFDEKDTHRNFSDLNNKMLEIEKLHFEYESGENSTSLKNINFQIKTGEMVGIIGRSGSGKSTIINLVTGLLSPSLGSIKYNSNKKSKKNLIGYVPQDIFLLDDTIRRNIAFGESDHEINDEKIYKAIKSAELEELINNKSEGLDLLVGEKGIRLSGGERQRIAIARALYREPEILIFDEATRSLDKFTEKQIIKSINKLKSKLTIIMVAHRLTTVENCDRIYFFDKGKVIDEGKLDYLLKKYPQIKHSNTN